jgi:hypothetical protein
MDGDRTSSERPDLCAGLVAHDVEASVGHDFEYAREDLAAEPEGGVNVGVVCKRPDEEDRGRIRARRVKGLCRDVDRERDREEGGATGGRPDIG